MVCGEFKFVPISTLKPGDPFNFNGSGVRFYRFVSFDGKNLRFTFDGKERVHNFIIFNENMKVWRIPIYA